ncbi:sigma-70 family RNA polymerase sigma factor [Blastopirellula marina]|uniref:RNA polymerase subunit sigma n=1 Tax=Blastopirellula marina TaxID=124 RepID=A0A2S8GBV7_9BACT|nr:sigma-70 family RNA polymerase sigma factor [Blastopirellula marina]PQO41945.1 RNA polymerase subunit sigma [Blastopirellula marina]PTL46302.1 RNA polymerase subunit sigma [Blastopirellula marina]
MSDFMELMRTIEAGEPQATDKLLPLVYDELRKLAAAHLANEPPGQTLQATALVHEAYLRLVGSDSTALWNSHAHFFTAASIAIRRILVDNARRKKSLKRGGDIVRQDLQEEIQITPPEPVEDLMALDEALEKLTQVHPQAAEIVQLVYFSGFTIVQAAELLGVSTRTADRLWAYARAWLRRELRNDDEKS